MSLPIAAEIHYEGCHCADICACSDPIECIHEQCICDRLSTAYERGREDAAQAVEAVEWWQGRVETFRGPEWGRHCDQDLAIAAARGRTAARGEDTK